MPLPPSESWRDELTERLQEALTALEQRERRSIAFPELASRISEMLGESVDPSSVNRWFLGTVEPSVRRLDAVARVLGCDPGWLAFGTAFDPTFEASQTPRRKRGGAKG